MQPADTVSSWMVTQEIRGAHPQHTNYPLLRGDLIMKRDDGTWGKFGPGLGIEGFVLTPEQEDTLRWAQDVPFAMGGLADYLAATSL